MSSIASLFAKAEQNLHLTPKERGFLRVLKNLGQSAIIVGIGSAAAFLTNPDKINIYAILESCTLLAVFSFINGFLHYLSSTQGLLPKPYEKPVQQLTAQAEIDLQVLEQKFLKDGGKGQLTTTGVIPIASYQDPTA